MRSTSISGQVARRGLGDIASRMLSRAAEGVGLGAAAHRPMELLEPRMLLTAGPVGRELHVDQLEGGVTDHPAVAMDNDGDFVVAWDGTVDEGGSSARSIFIRRYDSSGEAVGDQVKLASVSKEQQIDPDVAMDSAGNFVVAWTSLELKEFYSEYSIDAQRFTADGVAMGGVIHVNTEMIRINGHASVAMADDGRFVIAWESTQCDTCPTYIHGRYYSADGTPITNEFNATEFTTGYRHFPSAAMDSVGNFAIAWQAYEPDAERDGVRARRYNSAGLPIGDEFPVGINAVSTEMLPDVAADPAGNLIVAWSSSGEEMSSVRAQRYNATGQAQGGAFRVNATGAMSSWDAGPTVAMDGIGGFAAAWRADSGLGIVTRIFDANGSAVTEEVAATDSSAAQKPAIAMAPDGRFVVAWVCNPGTNAENGIFARFFDNSTTPVSIGNFVWNDVDRDGIQDAGEGGIDGITVRLYDADGLVGTATTSSGGYYHFNGLAPKDSYYLSFALPNGFTFSPQDQGAHDGLDSDVNPATGKTAIFSVWPGLTDATHDVGLIGPPNPSVGGMVWWDRDYNGIQDGDNIVGLPGFNVSLMTAEGEFVASTLTDAGGNYRFDGLVSGKSYYVLFHPVTGLHFTLPNRGLNDGLDSDADHFGHTVNFQLDPGEINLTFDAGVLRASMVIGNVYNDVDADGKHDFSETGLANRIVFIDTNGDGQFNDNGAEPNSITGLDGNYSIYGLRPGTYHVGIVPVAGWQTTSPQSGWHTVTVTSDVVAEGYDFAVTESPAPAKILGLMWGDTDFDGIQDDSETTLALGRVTLYTADGKEVASVDGGVYEFNGLAAGSYYLQFQYMSGMMATRPHQGTNDQMDSDVDPQTWRTPVFTLAAGQYETTQDAGFGIQTNLWIFAFDDANANGERDYPAEQSLPGVGFFLDTNSNRQYDVGERTIVTDGNGLAHFNDLWPGDYYVVPMVLPGYTVTSPAEGYRHVDLQTSPPIEMAFGFRNTGGVPAPIGPEIKASHPYAGFSDFDPAIASNAQGDFVVVWQSYFAEDHDTCGIYAQRYNATGQPQGEVITVHYLRNDDPHDPVVALGDDGSFVVVWQESDDNYLNHVYARRYNAKGEALEDEEGFQIGGGSGDVQMHPSVDMGPNGRFIVAWQGAKVINEDELPSDYDIYVQEFAADGEALTSETRINIRTALDQSNPSVVYGAEGGFLVTWQDQDGLCLSPDWYGIYARLFSDDGWEDPFLVWRDSLGSLINPVAAGSVSGRFAIAWQRGTGAPDDTGDIFAYRIDPSGGHLGGPIPVAAARSINETNPAIAMDAYGGFVITWQGRTDGSSSGGDIYLECYDPMGVSRGDSIWVKSVPNATQVNPAVASAATGDFVVAWQGGSPGDEDMPFGDWRIYAQRYWLIGQGGTIAGNVWFDANGNGIQDDALDLEYSMNDVTVNLLNEAGQVVTSTVTRDNGKYRFESIRPGSYRLQFVPPFGKLITLQNRGSNDELDSDADLATGITQLFTLGAGKTESTIDAGMINQCVVTGTVRSDVPNVPLQAWVVFLDANGNGTLDAGEQFAYTDVSGVYRMIALRPGTYTVAEVVQDHWTQVAPAGHSYTFTLGVNQSYSVPDFVNHSNVPIVAASPAGSEFRVNVDTNQDETIVDMASDAAGNFVVTYLRTNHSGPETGIYARLYSADGAPRGDLITVVEPDHGVTGGSVAMDERGNFIITWAIRNPGASGIFAQRYNALGVPQGNVFSVNNANSGYLANSRVEMDHDGDFTIFWYDQRPLNDPVPSGWWAHRYYPNGTSGGDAFRIVIANQPSWNFASLSMNGSGDLIVAYTRPGKDDFDLTIGVQRYDPYGRAKGGEIIVGGPTYRPSVALADNGDFVVTWYTLSPEAQGSRIIARRYNQDGVAQGGAFIVNTQGVVSCDPVVSMAADSGFIVAWDSHGIRARRYNAAGLPQGDELLVSSAMGYSQRNPEIALDNVGNFVVAWNSYLQDGVQYGVYAQRYRVVAPPPAVPLGSSFIITEIETYPHDSALIATAVNGDFVAAWDGIYDGDVQGIAARLFNANGRPKGPSFRVSPQEGDIRGAALACDAAGNFVVAWITWDSWGWGYGIDAQRYSSQGIPQGSVIHVASGNTNGYSMNPVAAMDADGDFVIAWDSAIDQDVHARRFNGSGVPQGDAFTVNTYTAGNQFGPVIAMSPTGAFTIAWESEGEGANYTGVCAQSYKPDGTRVGFEFMPSEDSSGPASTPAIAIDPSGNVAIAWESDVNDHKAIIARYFTPTGAPYGEFMVIASITGYEADKAALAVGVGKLVVAWHEPDSIFFRVFDQTGQPIGGPIAAPTGDVYAVTPTIGMAPSGQFVLSWTGSASGEHVSYGQIYQLPVPTPKPITLEGTPNADKFVIRRAGDQIQVFLNSTTTPTWSFSVYELTELNIDGGMGDDLFTIDYSGGNPSSSNGLLRILGGTSPLAVVEHDMLNIVGIDTTTGGYTPSGTTPGSGSIGVGGASVLLTGIEGITVAAANGFTITTANPDDNLTLVRLESDANMVSGTSGGVRITPITLRAVGTIKLDTGSNDGGAGDDLVTIPGGMASNSSLDVHAGTGNNSVVVEGGVVQFAVHFQLFGSIVPPIITGNFALTAAGGSQVTMYTGTGVSVLTIRDTAHVSVKADVSHTLRLRGLSISGKGTLDLGGNDLIVGSASAEPRDALLFQVNSLIAATRITNGTSDPLKRLAATLVDSSQLAGSFSAGSEAQVPDAAVLIKYTWNGDANLDGIINADDYFLIDSGYITQAKGWSNGDFNYDGLINADDYFLVDSAYGGQTGRLSSGNDLDPPTVLPEAQSPVTPSQTEEEYATLLQQLFSTEPLL